MLVIAMTESRFGNYSSCCRLCLTEKLNSLNNIYPDKDGLVEKIQLLIGVTVTQGDKLSTQLCQKCMSTINNWEEYKKLCVTNQNKLQKWMETWNQNLANTSFQIKDEPAEEDNDISEVISLDEEVVEIVKQEPTTGEEEYFDLPPPLTPHPPEIIVSEDVEINDLSEDSESLDKSGNVMRITLSGPNPNTCKICNRTFSTAGNRKKHEKAVHGPKKFTLSKPSRVVLNGDIEEVESLSGSQHSSEIGDIFLNATEKDQEKIEFAAGLCLQSKTATPKTSGLTTIEVSYLEKCRIMISMFNRVTCSCHNQYFNSFKKMLGHLRQLYSWFPPYTCHNCMVTFDGRSAKMRHTPRCPRLDFEQLIRLSELRARRDDKIRLYQNFKCMECNYVYNFYEDFCEHVDKEHVFEEGPYTCLCHNNYDSADVFRQHIHKSCYLNYHCDICFLITPSLDIFIKHCEDTHDIDEDFQFFSLHENFMVLNNIDIANILLGNKKKQQVLEQEEAENATVEEEAEIDVEPERRMSLKPIVPSAKYIATKCIKCDKTYSSYNNMLRHMKLSHHVENATKFNRNECDICGNDFSNYHNMLRHRKLHTEERKIQCPECPDKFRLNIELKDHINLAHAGRNMRAIYRCEECGQTFKNSTSLEAHVESEHNFDDEHICQECGKQFDDEAELEHHRSVHLNITLTRDPKTQNYRSVSPNKMCQICDKTFQNDAELQTHMQLHDKMPTLIMEDNMNGDQKDVKRYACDDCDKVYSGSRGLWVHNKRYHPNRATNRDFPKDCDQCDRTISTLAGWLMHKAMHDRTSQKMYSITKNNPPPEKSNQDSDSDYHTCKRCFKVFASKYNLKTHMKCHGINLSPSRTYSKAGKFNKTFWCDICHQACQGLAELTKHKQEHLHEEDSPELENQLDEDEPKKVFKNNLKQVYCKYCKIPFSNIDALNKHMADEHDEEVKPKLKKLIAASTKFACEICKKVFNSKMALSVHLGWHKRTKLDRALTAQQRLIKKEKDATIATSSKLFKCISCPMLFRDNTDLQLHILEVHRNINTTLSVKCPVCEMEFRSQAECDAHENTHYKQTPGKPGVTCKFCKRTFSRSDYLNIHINKKHPEYASVGTHKCHQCDRVFQKQNALTIHLKVHEQSMMSVAPSPAGGAKIYKYSCSICHIGFDVPKELRNHIIAKHPF